MLVEWLYVNKPSAKGLKKIKAPAFGLKISSGVLGLLELKVDIHGVALASPEAAGQWINARHTLECLQHRCVHDRVSAAVNDVGTGNRAILQNSDFYRANKGLILLENRCRLLPLAKKTIMNELVIPCKLVRVSPSTCLGSGTRPARR